MGTIQTSGRKRAFARAGLVVATLAAPAVARPQGVDREDAVTTIAVDVYVLVSGQLRNPVFETGNNEPLFNVAETPLGVTWGQFRSATATSRAHCPAAGTRTDVRLRMGNLVPNGVYSVFYDTFAPDSRNALCPGAERLVALPSKDPAQAPDFASFIADSSGEADFQARPDGCLLDAGRLQLVLIYHLDGLTWGEVPNRGEYVTQGPDCRSSFGVDAVRQTLIVQKTEG
jgi:hypothetical protein